MTKSYINKIKANIDIYSSKKATNVLDGTYVSVFSGRSMNFDDLRDYVPGDSMRDIEWKASSRSGKLLVKRFVAEKKHNIMFAIDTNLRMLGETNQGDSKKDLALYSVGTLAYLAYRNGDAIGMTYYKGNTPGLEPFRTGINNIERTLSLCDSVMKYSDKKSENIKKTISQLLETTVSAIKKRMILFVITDMKGAASIDETVLKRLKCLNDVLVVIAEDAQIIGQKKTKSFDISGKGYLPAFIGENKRLMKYENAKREEIKNLVNEKYKRCGIAITYIGSKDRITNSMIELLEHHRFESKVKK